MVLKNYNPDNESINNLVVEWMNILNPTQMDEFFWDYPGYHGHSSSGYGLGLVTARKIVNYRNKVPGDIKDMREIRKISGVGPDKVEDFLTQAREALSLAVWKSLSPDPYRIYLLLMKEGSGVALNKVYKAVRERLTKLSKSLTDFTVEIPFIALVHNTGSVNMKYRTQDQFPRIRTQPWAFVAHKREYRWMMTIKIERMKRVSMSVERMV